MFDPKIASDNIKNEFVDYIATTHAFSNPDLQKQFVKELQENISKGPFLEIKSPFKSGKSIYQLIHEDHVLSPLFEDLEAEKPEEPGYEHKLPIHRKLYLHQEKAIRTISKGNNAIVSTGTGSGKTNCFIIPVINELLQEKQAGTLGPGIRALFIYPMNALANDQIKYLREVLMYYPDITFGVYTGNTETDENDAEQVYEGLFAEEEVEELRHPLPNEILSRKEMKKSPPNILFTNYAMLEHLLLRPGDDVLFSNSHFKFIVLDEAHIYSGAKGIETAILLNRLKARMNVDENDLDQTQFILTSATLGSDDSVNEDILTFGESLCGAKFSEDSIIKAEFDEYPVSSEEIQSYPDKLYLDLVEHHKDFKEIFADYGIQTNPNKAEQEILFTWLLTTDLYDKLKEDIGSIQDLSEIIEKLKVKPEVAIAFIALCSHAQKNGKILIDTRYHFFVRALEGCYIALTPEKKLFLNRRQSYLESDKTYHVFEVAICSNCGKIALVGKHNESSNILTQANTLDSELDYFYFESDDTKEEQEDLIFDEEMGEIIEPVEAKGKKYSKEIYYLCPFCGSLTQENAIHSPSCKHGVENFIKVIKAKPLKYGGRCGNCNTALYRRVYLGNDAATSVLATALYEELPDPDYDSSHLSDCKQFLTFSDSRQEAAKFACYLGKSYQEFLRRRGIYQTVFDEKIQDIIKNSVYTVSDLVENLSSKFSYERSFAKSHSEKTSQTAVSRKNAWIAVLNELARFKIRNSLTSLGLIQFDFLGNDPKFVYEISKTYGVEQSVVKSLLDLLIFEIVKMGAIAPDSDSDIDDEDRKYLFYRYGQQFVSLDKENIKKGVSRWLPKPKKNGQGYIKCNRLNYVCDALNISEEEAVQFLEQYFKALTVKKSNDHHYLELNRRAGGYYLNATDFQVKIPGCENAHWYRCEKCGRITQFNIGFCPDSKCKGKLKEVDEPESISEDNHFANLYKSQELSALLVKEHTAQLSRDESSKYQQSFIKKDINALSCSTTFELGVDVGDLETVFLRNLPPLPANYAQRAGRAGRSLEAAAFALTFAKLSSHDLTFFNDPKKMIGGTILPPLFKVDNDKIVLRHIFAVALSLFFKMNPEQYNRNNAEVFINQQGYKDFLSWIESRPKNLLSLLKRSIPETNDLQKHEKIDLENFTWEKEFWGEDGVFKKLITEYENNVAGFEKLMDDHAAKKEFSIAGQYEKKLKQYKNNKLIDFLARGNVLPRYGFPVDTVELQTAPGANSHSNITLSRDLQIAIADYAPSSEIVADDKLYVSRYIKKTAVSKDNQDWEVAYLATCTHCDTINYRLTPLEEGEEVQCFSCHNPLYKSDFKASIEPRSGFVAEHNVRDVPMRRQEKNYKSEDYYIGDTSAKTIDSKTYLFNSNEVKIESTSNDSLVVKSDERFYVCPKCGYAYSDDELKSLRKNKKIEREAAVVTTKVHHKSLFALEDCDCQNLKRYFLHHKFSTDVVKITFDSDCDTGNFETMVSVMYAILNAIANELNIERRDIKACLSSYYVNHQKHHSIIIYDAVPGGAGHTRRLVTEDGKILYQILMAALGSMENCDCDPSCYNCLRSYENQKIHDSLDRHLAIDFLKQFKGDVEILED